MAKIAILITVFNRKETTLKCLDFLTKSINEVQNYTFDIYLTDDNCTDGTSQAIKDKFKSVKILTSGGELYWCRGMLLAWNYASRIKNYDFYLWLNDDVILFENAINSLITSSELVNSPAIISGAFRSQFNNVMTYGGMINDRFIIPNGKLQEFDFLNGNLVLIPKIVYENIGMLDGAYHHGMADFDYGLRAKKKGFKLFLTSDYVGYCERHDPIILKCYDSKYPIISRFKFLYAPNGLNPFVNYRFYLKHYSVLKAVYFIIATNLATAFPFLRKK